MESTALKEHSGSELWQGYVESDSADKDIFAEQRSNILLIAGDHYYRAGNRFQKSIRDHRELTEQQKIRLTRNHIQKIHEIYKNYILGACPGVGFSPNNESELQDQKAAELAHSIWKDGADRQNFNTGIIEDAVEDYLGLGEVAAKLYFDPNKGPIYGYRPLAGQAGPAGEPLPDMDSPVRRGEIVIELIHGFNLLRSPNAKSFDDSECVRIRRMSKVADLVAQFKITDADVVRKIEETSDETMVVYDSNKGEYTEAAKGQTMVVEHYYRPCARYKKGYFYITVAEQILAKGELPAGVFPVMFAPCHKIQTSPRGRSPIKQMRPYQVEINRAASKIAEHHITLGDDKLIIQNGSKVSSGVSLPGVRSVFVTGAVPTVMPGRDGSQFLAVLQQTITELYSIMNVSEMIDDSKNETDVFAMLFKSASQKRRFSRIISRFERFLVDVAKGYLELAKYYLPDDAIINAVGKSERINISEFKNLEPLCYQVKIDPESEDIETKMGKQLAFNQILQYVGGQLSREEIGKIIRLMPFTNNEKQLEDLTINYDLGTNAILALDRGQMPIISEFQDIPYIINRVTFRMSQADYQFLQPQVKQAYEMYKQQLYALKKQQDMAAARAASGLIPTDGYLVNVEFYITEKDGKTRRAKLPYASVAWLLEQLEAQSATQESLETMNKGALTQLYGVIQDKAMGGMNPGMLPAGGPPMQTPR